MVPIVTPAEMRAIDAAAISSGLVDEATLIERAGSAVARAAVRMMGGTYGRTVHVIAGKGNNGMDGRVAARRLAERGVRVFIHDAATCARRLPAADLVIDAAYGTGLRDGWAAPDVSGTPVLAVDLPSGVDGLTGRANGDVLAAQRTVALAALKPGLLFGDGHRLAGEVEVADIGLACDGGAAWHVSAADVSAWVPARDADDHKWRTAVRVVAGSAGMSGAARLVVAAALRGGAGMVHASVPGRVVPELPLEAVQPPLPEHGWAGDALRSLDRFHSLVVGPGLGRDDGTVASVRAVVVGATCPTVVDGDALFALSWGAEGPIGVLRSRPAATVLTPHDGEFALLTGERPGDDRIGAARRLAFDTGCVVLLKGVTTVVADADGQVLVVTEGDERLATAGTGDVLAGLIGALLAAGVPPARAAAAAAWLHGRAGKLGRAEGVVAGDLPDLLPTALASVR